MKVTDAIPRDITHHVYDMTGQLCYTLNIDSGRRWMMVNALDKPVHTWDNLLRKTTIQYDALNRPVATLLYNNSTTALKVESITYGTSATGYTIGRPVTVRDQSGKVDYTSYDFKGNMLSSTRRFANDYNGIIDWFSYPDPTGESFDTEFTFDAMNRPVTETTPDGKVRTYEYNKAGLLERVLLDGIEYVTSVEYNEKGQRTDIIFGNNSKTRYFYDTQTFRLTRLLTTRFEGQDMLHDLNFTYDPEGNIVQQDDNAQQSFYFNNTVVSPVGKYEYDALYRLVKAEGRELTSLGISTDADFVNNILVPNAGSGVMQNYTQLYSYDKLGNIISVQSQGRWTRDYFYDFPINLPGTNRLLRHDEFGGNVYTYDAHGNILSMPHLDIMEWDYKGNLIKTVGGTITTYYRYDSSGNRVRKIAIKTGGITEERIYNGNYEVYRKKTGGTLTTERQSSFVSDDTKRIAIIDTRTTPSPIEVTIRYQYDNHLGSACLELDGSAQVISYEEYHPFGTTSYRAGRNATETSLKRYKYVGKELDEETGLYYYGARYYAAWLCRFVSVDPLQFNYPELTPFQYASNRPITGIDLDGLEFLNTSDPNIENSCYNEDGTGEIVVGGQTFSYYGIHEYNKESYYQTCSNIYCTNTGIKETGEYNELITEMFIMEAEFSSIFPNSTNANQTTSIINSNLQKFDIKTPVALSHFLSQAGHESGGFSNLDISENLNYSASRLVAVWPGKFSLGAIEGKVLASDYAKNPEKLGNYVYANINGNSDEKSGEGYKFRGRGIFQLTGKSNYQDLQSFYNDNYNPDLDLIKNPAQISLDANLSVISALWFFKTKVLNKINIQNSSVESVTKIVNGGKNGLIEREKIFKNSLNTLR